MLYRISKKNKNMVNKYEGHGKLLAALVIQSSSSLLNLKQRQYVSALNGTLQLFISPHTQVVVMIIMARKKLVNEQNLQIRHSEYRYALQLNL